MKSLGTPARQSGHAVTTGTRSLRSNRFAYYNKNDGVRVTDLHQGIVWGTQTEQTKLDERLISRFDYDGDYGTVLNRFLMQAAVGYPLTVHGTGGQTRAFIHIQDTVQCLQLATANPPAPDTRVRIINQMTETCRMRDLEKLVAECTGARIQNLRIPARRMAETSCMSATTPSSTRGSNRSP